jgi:hypothetical protein
MNNINNTIKGFVVEAIYLSGETSNEGQFDNIKDAVDYYESLILELKEEFEDEVTEVIDYITIYIAESTDAESVNDLGIGDFVKNIETYTYDKEEN